MTARAAVKRLVEAFAAYDRGELSSERLFQKVKSELSASIVTNDIGQEEWATLLQFQAISEQSSFAEVVATSHMKFVVPSVATISNAPLAVAPTPTPALAPVSAPTPAPASTFLSWLSSLPSIPSFSSTPTKAASSSPSTTPVPTLTKVASSSPSTTPVPTPPSTNAPVIPPPSLASPAVKPFAATPTSIIVTPVHDPIQNAVPEITWKTLYINMMQSENWTSWFIALRNKLPDNDEHAIIYFNLIFTYIFSLLKTLDESLWQKYSSVQSAINLDFSIKKFPSVVELENMKPDEQVAFFKRFSKKSKQELTDLNTIVNTKADPHVWIRWLNMSLPTAKQKDVNDDKMNLSNLLKTYGDGWFGILDKQIKFIVDRTGISHENLRNFAVGEFWHDGRPDTIGILDILLLVRAVNANSFAGSLATWYKTQLGDLILRNEIQKDSEPQFTGVYVDELPKTVLSYDLKIAPLLVELSPGIAFDATFFKRIIANSSDLNNADKGLKHKWILETRASYYKYFAPQYFAPKQPLGRTMIVHNDDHVLSYNTLSKLFECVTASDVMEKVGNAFPQDARDKAPNFQTDMEDFIRLVYAKFKKPSPPPSTMELKSEPIHHGSVVFSATYTPPPQLLPAPASAPASAPKNNNSKGKGKGSAVVNAKEKETEKKEPAKAPSTMQAPLGTAMDSTFLLDWSDF